MVNFYYIWSCQRFQFPLVFLIGKSKDFLVIPKNPSYIQCVCAVALLAVVSCDSSGDLLMW